MRSKPTAIRRIPSFGPQPIRVPSHGFYADHLIMPRRRFEPSQNAAEWKRTAGKSFQFLSRASEQKAGKSFELGAVDRATDTNFSVGTTEPFTDRNRARQSLKDWHRIVAFGRLADMCKRLLFKGRQVYIEGWLSIRQYEAKDRSRKRYRTEIVALQLRMLGNRTNGTAPNTKPSEQVPF